MDAVNFIKEYSRMCNKYDDCQGCPLDDKGCDITYEQVNANHIANTVEKWAKENPQKTMMQDFFNRFPNAPKDIDGNPVTCPYSCGYVVVNDCEKYNNCYDCWNRPIEE